MISRIKGRLVKKSENLLLIEINGIFYDVNIPQTVYTNLNREENQEVELVIYHYFNMDKNRAIPVMIGFLDEMEKEFFEKFIKVSGIGPKSTIRAFDKPISIIAQAVEEGDVDFLQTLDGIGKNKAKQIIASLQGKVGRFVLLEREEVKEEPLKKNIKEIIEGAKQILKRLQYSNKEIETMTMKALEVKPNVDNIEDLLNEIYRQRK